MKLVVLKHIHKRGSTVYHALVDDHVTLKSKDRIIASMIDQFEIDYDQGGLDVKESEILDLKLIPYKYVPLLKISKKPIKSFRIMNGFR